MDTQGLKADGAEAKAAAERSKTKSSEPPALLSRTQLALRRGLTLLVLVLILAAGVALHVAFPVPEPSILSGANGTLNQEYNATSPPLTLMDFTLKP